MTSHDRKRGAAAPVVILLAGLVAAGAYNYHRNWKAEQAEPRPYRSHSDSNLAALIEAYEDEAQVANRRYESARQQKAERRGGALLDERVEDFERARRVAETGRRLASDAVAHESVLDELLREQRLRAQDATGLSLHLRRLTRL